MELVITFVHPPPLPDKAFGGFPCPGYTVKGQEGYFQEERTVTFKTTFGYNWQVVSFSAIFFPPGYLNSWSMCLLRPASFPLPFQSAVSVAMADR